ncbi:MAG: hypothetical protein ACHP9T_01195 [Caulobacterales bacterium]|jgi:anti-sigma factor ChrR (cupin superfamily)
MRSTDHPSAADLLDFAVGSQAAGRSTVSAHLAACPACRETVRILEEAGGAFLESLPAAALDPDALDRALAALDAEGDDGEAVGAAAGKPGHP